jgi:hypothetical protein
MSSAIRELAAAAAAKKGAPKEPALEAIWRSICAFITQTMQQGKVW